MKFKDILYGILTEDQEGVYKKYFSDIKRDHFIRIVSADPKTVIKDDKILRLGSYYSFLIAMYKNNNLKFEDLPKAKEYLELIYKYNIKIGQMKIQTISDLYEIVKDKIAKTNANLSEVISALDKSEYSVKTNDDDWFIVVPLTEKAAAYLGVNTEWCTTWGNYCLNPKYKDRTNHFKTYSPQGPLYIIVNKKNESEKYQLHFPSNQLKDAADIEVKSRPDFFNNKQEVKKYFFPSLFASETNIENIKSELTKAKKFLDESDLAFYREKLYAEYGNTNPFVAALNNENEEDLIKFISDENITYSIYRGNLEFEYKNVTASLDGYDSALSTLRSWEYNAYNDVSDSEYYSYRDSSQDILEGYLTTYYEKNKTKLIELFGFYCRDYDNFINFSQESGLFKDENVKDKYLEEFTSGSGAALENAASATIKEYEAILDIRQGWSTKTATMPLEKVIDYVADKELYSIESFETFIDGYIEHHDLPDGDYVDYPEYDYVYPSQDFMEEVFDEYFENKHEEFFDGENGGCKEDKDKLIKIFEKYFSGSGVYENEFVKIELKQPWFKNFTCEDGIKITLLNKKTNKTEEGFVQVDSLVNHMQIEPLFERLSLSNLIKNI